MKKPHFSSKRILWLIGILVVIIISLVTWRYQASLFQPQQVLPTTTLIPSATPSPTATLTPTATPSPTITPSPAVTLTQKEAWEVEKLKQEVEKLKQEKDWWTWFWSTVAPALSTLFSTAIVLLTAGLGFHQWQKDHRISQLKREEDYRIEQAKLDEERFQKVVEGLGSEIEEARVGAAIMMLTFLRPGYEKFYSQTFLLAVAHLRLRKADPKIPEPLDAMSQAVITVFREAFSKARDNIENFSPENLDAAGVHMDTAYLSKVDLRKIRVRNAFFREAILWKAQLQGSYFKYSNLTNANIGRANLSDADFSYTILKKAKLAHSDFENTDLTEADLEGADMTNTNLERAKKLDGTILRNVKGLSEEQLAMCAAKGAIVDNIPVEH